MPGVWPKLRAVGRLCAVAGYAAPLVAAQVLVAGPVFKDYETVPRQLNRGILKIAGIRVAFNGAVANDRPTIFAANHMSYLDIILLGAHIPGSFVAKKEVRDWPVIGMAGAAAKAIFIERRIGTLRRDQRQIIETLNSGRNVILFPEGTTSRDLLPFKGGLLCTAFNNVSRVNLAQEIHVQPVSLCVTHINGRSMAEEPELDNHYAWVGGQNLAKHFWQLVLAGSMDVAITMHDPMHHKDYADRRVFAKTAEDRVRSACRPSIRP